MKLFSYVLLEESNVVIGSKQIIVLSYLIILFVFWIEILSFNSISYTNLCCSFVASQILKKCSILFNNNYGIWSKDIMALSNACNRICIDFKFIGEHAEDVIRACSIPFSRHNLFLLLITNSWLNWDFHSFYVKNKSSKFESQWEARMRNVELLVSISHVQQVVAHSYRILFLSNKIVFFTFLFLDSKDAFMFFVIRSSIFTW